MKQRKPFVSVLLFAAFVLLLLPFGNKAAPELPPEGWIGIYGREDLEKISLAPEEQYILMNDIDLSGADWTPLCTEDIPFSGVLDGNGFTVYGMTAVSDGSACGLFSHISEGTVLRLSVAGRARGFAVGLLAGKIHSSEISDCSVSGQVEGTFCAGGLAGQLSGENSRLFACVADSITTLTVEESAPLPATEEEGTEGAEGDVSAETPAETDAFLGGLLGAVWGNGTTLRSCETFGDLSFTGSRCDVGGLIGFLDGDATLEECGTETSLTLSLSSEGTAGGLVGRTGRGEIAFRSSSFRGDWSVVPCNGSVSLGGIAGRIVASSSVTVEGCIAFGSLNSTAASSSLGGIVGVALAAEGNVSVLRCSSFADLSASGNPLSMGGICGVNRGEGGIALIQNCHADGTILHTDAPIRDPSLAFGGICGSNGGSGISEISLCFSVCDMKITYPITDGAVVGINYPHSEDGIAAVTQCYYRQGVREFFATPLSGEALSDPASYNGFDFEQVWRMDESFAMPVLRPGIGSEEPLSPGDVDGNGRITRYDGTLLMQYLTGRTVLSDGQLLRADINGDGELDARDVSLILRNAM